MSNLVSKVAFRIRAEQYLKHKEEDQARAAIAAVAEWLDENGDEWTVGARRILLKQLEQPK